MADVELFEEISSNEIFPKSDSNPSRKVLPSKLLNPPLFNNLFIHHDIIDPIVIQFDPTYLKYLQLMVIPTNQHLEAPRYDVQCFETGITAANCITQSLCKGTSTTPEGTKVELLNGELP